LLELLLPSHDVQGLGVEIKMRAEGRLHFRAEIAGM